MLAKPSLACLRGCGVREGSFSDSIGITARGWQEALAEAAGGAPVPPVRDERWEPRRLCHQGSTPTMDSTTSPPACATPAGRHAHRRRVGAAGPSAGRRQQANQNSSVTGGTGRTSPVVEVNPSQLNVWYPEPREPP